MVRGVGALQQEPPQGHLEPLQFLRGDHGDARDTCWQEQSSGLFRGTLTPCMSQATPGSHLTARLSPCVGLRLDLLR